MPENVTDAFAVYADALTPERAPDYSGVTRAVRRRRRRQASAGVTVTVAAVVVAGAVLTRADHGARTATVAQPSGVTSATQQTTSTQLVPPKGTVILGPAGQPDAMSGGRLTMATGAIANTGFGLVAPPANAHPRHSAQQAYQLRNSLVESGQTGGHPEQQTGPVITLAMATTSYYKPSHHALVWVFLWPDQRCGFSGGPPVGPGTTPPTADPSGTPCTSWAIMSDALGKIMIGGDQAD
jgi:hypothetical protein